MKRIVLISFALLSFISCAQMRDYVADKDDIAGVGIKTGFDEGVDKKDYYMVDKRTSIILRDTKNEVISKIGMPTKREKTLEGYDCWIYEDKKIKLFFEGEYLNRWEEFSKASETIK